jgi:fucose 4-O-acetylase-like acetyltransferase
MKERLNSWDTLKGLCILCVLFGHLLSEMPFSVVGSLTLFGIYAWHVPLFMTISGRFAKFNIRRALFFIALFVIFRSWFIGVLGLYLFLTPLLSKVTQTKSQILLTLSAFVAGVLFGFVPLPTNLWYISKFVAFLPFFIFGYYRLFEKIQIKHKVLTCIALFVATFMLFPWFQNTLPFAMSGTYFNVTWLHRVAVYAIGLGWTIWWINAIPNKHAPLLTTLGTITCGIYVFHDPFVPMVAQWIKPLIAASPVPTLTVLLITAVWIAILWYPAVLLNKLMKLITSKRSKT